jgi:enoyl-[acyl-carrier protein] reductase III
MTLSGKVAVVTGSSRTIGRGVAVSLARRGASVVVNYLSREDADRETLSLIEAEGARGIIVQADVAQPDHVQRLAQTAIGAFGSIDIFVSNAPGDLLGFLRPPTVLTLEQWDVAHRAQARAFFVAVQTFAPVMNDRGRIVAMSYWPGSHSGGFQPYFAMGVNKAALESMCRYFAVAFAPRGITVNAVCPGITDDSIVNQLPPDAQAAMLGWLKSGWGPTGRAGTPADVGAAVAAICSDDAQWITGQTIAAEGGASLMSPEVPLAF